MKKIISILVALGLVLAMSVMATPVSADTCMDDAVDACAVVAVTPGVECVTCATYNLTFTPHTMMAWGVDYVAVDFPAGANISGVTQVNMNGVNIVGNWYAVDWTQIRAIPTAAVGDLPAGVPVTLDIICVVNPPYDADGYTLQIWTVLDTCPCDAAFTIAEGGEIVPPDPLVWCPCHNLTFDVIWNGSSNITAVDGATYGSTYFVDFGKNTTTVTCAYLTSVAGNVCDEIPLEFEFDAGCNVTYNILVAEACNVTLDNGWNLMSLPLIPINAEFDTHEAAIEDVLAEILPNVVSVWYYDGCDDEWGAWNANGNADFGLSTMATGKAYWVCTNASTTLHQCGFSLPCPPGGPPCYCYCNCWNMVGYPKCTSMNRSAFLANLVPAGSLFGCVTYNSTGWHTINAGDNMRVGYGYFMAFNADACFAPPV